jgi:hypothetical protein
MKYLKSYNESLRNLMTPKSEDEILKSLKGLDNSDILQKSIKYEFLKGIKLALQNELTENDISFIKENICNIENLQIIILLLDIIKNKLGKEGLYLIEKYKLGLHQDEEKPYEIWFKTQLTDLDIDKSKQDNQIILFKKDKDILFYYNERNKRIFINFSKIWIKLSLNFNLNFGDIKILTKYIIINQLKLDVVNSDIMSILYDYN